MLKPEFEKVERVGEHWATRTEKYLYLQNVQNTDAKFKSSAKYTQKRVRLGKQD